MRINNPNQFVLCCRGKKCPVVTFEDNEMYVTIRDDYENTVKMTTEQFMEIGKVIEHRNSKDAE